MGNLWHWLIFLSIIVGGWAVLIWGIAWAILACMKVDRRRGFWLAGGIALLSIFGWAMLIFLRVLFRDQLRYLEDFFEILF